jgi:3-oxoadipate enol-lactonase
MVERPAFIEAGKGPVPLVFLHGIGSDSSCFAREVARFGQQRHAVAWDAPGYGASAFPDRFDWATLAEAVKVLLDYLGAPTAIIYGHSMGGMVAQEFAARYPERLAALALVGTTPAFGSRDGNFEKEFLGKRLAPLDEGRTLADLAPELVKVMIGDHPSAAGLATAKAATSRLSPDTYRAALKNLVGFDRKGDLARIAVPTLVLAGEKDPNAPARTMKRMAETIKGAAYREIPGCGHLINLEQPEAHDAILDEFLATLPA